MVKIRIIVVPLILIFIHGYNDEMRRQIT